MAAGASSPIASVKRACSSTPAVCGSFVVRQPVRHPLWQQRRQTVRLPRLDAARQQENPAEGAAAVLPRVRQPKGQLNNALPKAKRRPLAGTEEQRGAAEAAVSPVKTALQLAEPSEADTRQAGEVLDAAEASAAVPDQGTGTTPGHQPATGTVLGAIALITGSTVGAGILALPAVTAPAGFLPSAATMVAVWALLAAESLLLAEVNLAIRAQQADASSEGRSSSTGMVTLHQMAEASFGQAGASATSVVYLGLSYSLLIAYIAKASTVISSGSGGAIASEAAGYLFTGVMGSMLWLGGARAAEAVNGVLTAALLALFCAVVVQGSQHADFASLTSVADWSAAPACVPIVFLSLVYHDLVPVICDLLGGDRRRIATALLTGSLLPLAMFLTWNAVTLAVMPSAGMADTSGGTVLLDPLEVLTQHGNSSVGAAIAAFSVLAIATSFIGTTLGLASTISEEIKSMAGKLPPVGWLQRGSPLVPLLDGEPGSRHEGSQSVADEEIKENMRRGGGLSELAFQGLVYGLVLAPPLRLAIGNPAAFFGMLNVAGAYGMTILYGVVPPLMALRVRHSASLARGNSNTDQLPASDPARHSAALDQQSRLDPPQHRRDTALMMPGGRPALLALCCMATGVTVGRLWADLGQPSGNDVLTAGSAAVVGVPAAFLLAVH